MANSNNDASKNAKTLPVGRSNFLSGPMEANLDIRKACNVLKRTALLSSACALTGSNPSEMTEFVERISNDILQRLGFSSNDQHRMGVLLSMISEPVSLVVAESALLGATTDEILAAGANFVKNMVELAQSKVTNKIITEHYPNDLTGAIALRMTSATSMTQLAVETAHFCFYQQPEKIIKEASQHVTRAAYDAAIFIAGENATSNSRTVLAQSLMQSGGKIYAACFRSIAAGVLDSLNMMNAEEKDIAALKMKNCKPGDVLKDVTKMFHDLFDACINEYIEAPEPFLKKSEVKNTNRP